MCKGWKHWLAVLVVVTGMPTSRVEAQFETAEPSMLQGRNDWETKPLFTVGETIGAYTPAGILDGLGAYSLNARTVRVLASHELGRDRGYVYQLANGTGLTGARISYFDIDVASRKIVGSGSAFNKIYDRAGKIVTNTVQLELTTAPGQGLSRLCSATLVEANRFGFVDTVFFSGEESADGTMWVLDAKTQSLWAAPALGRGGWENATAIDTGRRDRVALLLANDTGGAPLLLYVGTKNTKKGASFLDRNGLKNGKLYAWKTDSGDLVPSDFNGDFGDQRTGTFVPLVNFSLANANRDVDNADGDNNPATGIDFRADGFATEAWLSKQADDLGCFSFSRPEDLSTNPHNGRQVVFASTGLASFDGGADSWGTTYTIDLDFSNLNIPAGQLTILHNGNLIPDGILRSPDNLVWADNGLAYIQEDRSVAGFGANGVEASILEVIPGTGDVLQIAEIDRTSVAPAGTTDPSPADVGNWESSGIIDVTRFFTALPGERLLLVDVQAHSLRDGPIAAQNLVEGGQLVFVSYAPVSPNGVIATYDAAKNEIRLLGSRNDDSVAIVTFPSFGVLIQGLNGTLVNDQATAFLPAKKGSSVKVNLSNGTDRLDILGTMHSTVEVFCGEGDDQVNLVSATVASLSVFGNAGDDSVSAKFSKVTKSLLSSVETFTGLSNPVIVFGPPAPTPIVATTADG